MRLGRFLNGSVDEVRLYDTTMLDDAAIASLR
jgi:hypothetical protein